VQTVSEETRPERSRRRADPGYRRTQGSQSSFRLSIAPIVTRTFRIDIDKNVVYRVLAKYYRPTASGTGPSWLTFIGHATDSLWSVDLFRCESIVLKTY